MGFAMMMFLAYSGIGRWLTDSLGVSLSMIVVFTVPLIVGALLGDLIGRKRGYALFLVRFPEE